MADFKLNAKYDFDYYTCVYSGISRRIEHEIDYGTEDKRQELKYIVDRYNNEIVVSGAYLTELYEKYVESLKERGVIE